MSDQFVCPECSYTDLVTRKCPNCRKAWMKNGLENDVDRLTARVKELEETCAALIDHPEGCMCPNNGGGDCDWCQIVDSAKLELEEHDNG